MLNNERDLINNDLFLDDDKRQELVTKLIFESYLRDATTHLEDIEKCLACKRNTKANLNNIKEVIKSNQISDRKLLTLLRTMLSGDK